MPLYGHELSEQWTPVQAGLSFAIDTEDRDFIGREALLAAAADVDLETRVGLALSGKRVPREDYPVLVGESRIGRITSGTFSPTLGKPIAMAYVAPAFSEPGTSVEVDIRGRQVPATVVDLPFYRRRR